MKFVVVRTETQIGAGANASVNCDTFLYDSMTSATDKARRMYGEVVKEFADSDDLVVTSYEESVTILRLVEAKIFGSQAVVVIAVNKVEESEVNQ